MIKFKYYFLIEIYELYFNVEMTTKEVLFMKVLILSITAGQGHNSTANAVAGYCEEAGIECVTLDTLK